MHPNTEGSPENKEKILKKTGSNLDALIREVVLTGKRDDIDPRIVNALDAGGDRRLKMLQEIKNSLKNEYDKGDYIFDESDIDAMTDSVLRGYIERHARPLRGMRKNFRTILKKEFPHASLPEKIFQDDLFDYTASEIGDILETHATMKRFLTKEYGMSTTDLEVWSPKLSELFQPETLPDGEFKNRLIKNITRFEKSRTPFDREFVRELVGYYGNDVSMIEKIAKAFGITFSLRDALNYDLVDQDQVDTFVENEYRDIWHDITDAQKRSLKLTLSRDDTTQYSIEDLNRINASLMTTYDGKRFKEIFAKSINGRMDDAHQNPDREYGMSTIDDFTSRIESKKHIRISPLSALVPGAVMVCQDKRGNKNFIKIEAIDVDMPVYSGAGGMQLVFLDGTASGTIGNTKEGTRSIVSYEDLEKKLMTMSDIQVMNEGDLRQQIAHGMFSDTDGQVIRDVSAEENEVSLEYLRNELDSIDPEGRSIPLEKDMIFSAKVSDEKDSSPILQSFTVIILDNGIITFTNGRDIEHASYRDFVNICRSKDVQFQRIGKLSNDDDFLKALSVFGVKGDTKIKDNALKVEDEVDEVDDHGHAHKHKKEVSYEYFTKGDEGEHIRVVGIGDSFVNIWEYEPSNGVTLEKLQKAKATKKLSKSQEKSQYKLRTMTRAQFLAYLKENKLKATTKDLLDSDAEYHPHDPHMHSSAFGTLFKGLSINDMLKGFQNIVHGWEHYFEKNSKLNASRFALKMGRKFGFPTDIMAQLQADEVSSMKEIIEKIQEKLSNLNGPVARKKALHIAQLTSSSPEEIGASMLYMVKGYGQLYAEDIAYGRGHEHFINGFLYSLGWRGDELTKMKKDARDKYIGDLGSGSDGGKPTEEEMIWCLLKIIDGGAGREKGDPKYDPRYANAGAVVKAMGGPSGWEKAWREGRESAYQKGIRQGSAVVNAKGRVNKGISALKTFELNTAMGFMEKAAGKTPHPQFQTIAVLWALGGYSHHCDTEMKQKVKSYGDSQGHTLHAYAFLRNGEDNNTYTKVFVQALGAIDPSKAATAQKAIDTIRKGPRNDNNDTKKAYEDAIDTLSEIWEKNWSNGLHDHLQGKSTWIINEVNKGNKDVEMYAERFANIHLMNSNTTPPANDNDYWLQFGYRYSGMFGDNKGNAFKIQDNKKVLSLGATLNKLTVNGYELDTNSFDRLWPLIIESFNELKKEPNEELRKAQYKQFREDMILHFRNRMSIRAGGIDTAMDEVGRKSYAQDILNMGIDLRELFVKTPLSLQAEGDYQKWINRSGYTSASLSGGGNSPIPSVQDWVGNRTAGLMPSQNGQQEDN